MKKVEYNKISLQHQLSTKTDNLYNYADDTNIFKYVDRSIPINERLIVAIDETNLISATHLLMNAVLGGAVFFKIGLRTLATDFGLGLVDTIKNHSTNFKVFLDVKLYDIPDQVEAAAKAYAEMGVDFITVHAFPGNVKAAVEGVKGTNTKVLVVTVLTSHTQDDLYRMGFNTMSIQRLVIERASTAQYGGAHGLVCSPHESNYLAARHPNMIIVTPGIRDFKLSNTDDQHRTATVEEAFNNSADYVVVGRPIKNNLNIVENVQHFQTRIQNIFK